ncbi:CbtA family protein [Nocardioides sp. GXZ039]|uniref:CbtA family protein n=1 Tax=Nocardioides sp. GXZ039 TaxID=3136018 RepID=UPI0030F4AA3D
MNARAFLIRGLLAGLVAGLATFFVAYLVAEPQVEAAISLEDAGASGEPAAEAHSHDHDEAAHSHSHGEEGGAEVSRSTQRTWGLLTGTLTIGLALGGIVALVSAGAVGRIGRLLPGQTVALVALIGFVSVALVPFLKYPANPPAVGSGDTIGDRTALYFGFLLLSVLAAVAATYAAVRLRGRIGTYGGTVIGAAGYLVVMVAAAEVFATVNELGDFPADVLWYFRRASLITLATMWGVLGVVLAGLVGRLYRREAADADRRALAASL